MFRLYPAALPHSGIFVLSLPPAAPLNLECSFFPGLGLSWLGPDLIEVAL